ncbi:hypothetical protein ILYODFUR_005682 [Ilyodon furcidens]|uniref:Uncharacterized protein n=1 Tax=Ilyodon furcidens TaxID=33524 RepID=A0ABV0UR95_9TELE
MFTFAHLKPPAANKKWYRKKYFFLLFADQMKELGGRKSQRNFPHFSASGRAEGDGGRGFANAAGRFSSFGQVRAHKDSGGCRSNTVCSPLSLSLSLALSLSCDQHGCSSLVSDFEVHHTYPSTVPFFTLQISSETRVKQAESKCIKRKCSACHCHCLQRKPPYFLKRV